MKIQLYYHRTDGGAEYLTDTFISCRGGHREGIFEGAQYTIRIDGNIRKDATLDIKGGIYELPLYYHQTDGGAEYLTDKFIICRDGHSREGIFEGAKYIIRLDGDIRKDATMLIKEGE